MLQRENKVMRVTKRENVGGIGITLNGIRMDEGECFRYLGVDIEIDGGVKSVMKHCVIEGEKISSVLWKIWKGERMSKDTRRSLYEGILVLTLLYGSEL
jgi:hypothetical protein